MPQRLNNNLQALPDSLRAPRQINDQRPLPDPGRSPAQHRPLRDRQTKRPHRLRNPRPGLQAVLQAGSIPPQLVQMLPYVATIVVLIFARGSSRRAPAAEGKHYYAKGEQ